MAFRKPFYFVLIFLILSCTGEMCSGKGDVSHSASEELVPFLLHPQGSVQAASEVELSSVFSPPASPSDSQAQGTT